MKPLTVIGIVLIVLGALALAYQGIGYTKREKVLDIGPIEASTTTHKTLPIPPIIGALALGGGIVMVVAGARRRT